MSGIERAAHTLRAAAPRMLGLTFGETFVVAFVTIAVVSARFWPLLGERLASRISAKEPKASEPPRAE